MNHTEYKLHLPMAAATEIFSNSEDHYIVNDLRSVFRTLGELRQKGYRATAKRINGKLAIAAGVL